jgi:hypothetical protein
MRVVIFRSNRKNKKWIADNGIRKIHFGEKYMQDYTQHKDIKRQVRFIKRFNKLIDIYKDDPNSSMFWSYHLLWNKPTITEAINDIKKKFKIEVVFF